MEWYLINPVVSAIIFTTGTLCLKRGLSEGTGVLRSSFITNSCFTILLVPLVGFSGFDADWSVTWAAVLAGLMAFSGAFFQLMAIKVGDLSVANPLLGAKVLFVAVFSTFILGNQLPMSWWGGVFLAMIGVGFLGYAKSGSERKRVGLTLILILLSVSCFAVMDVLTAGWAKQMGFNRFVAVQQLVVMTLTFGLIPFFSSPLKSMPRSSWSWTLAGSVLIVGQFYLLNWTLSEFGQPTLINILYSSRGMWSVVMVFFFGALFGIHERAHGRMAFIRRFLGASFLMGAILLAVL